MNVKHWSKAFHCPNCYMKIEVTVMLLSLPRKQRTSTERVTAEKHQHLQGTRHWEDHPQTFSGDGLMVWWFEMVGIQLLYISRYLQISPDISRFHSNLPTLFFGIAVPNHTRPVMRNWDRLVGWYAFEIQWCALNRRFAVTQSGGLQLGHALDQFATGFDAEEPCRSSSKVAAGPMEMHPWYAHDPSYEAVEAFKGWEPDLLLSPR